MSTAIPIWHVFGLLWHDMDRPVREIVRMLVLLCSLSAVQVLSPASPTLARIEQAIFALATRRDGTRLTGTCITSGRRAKRTLRRRVITRVSYRATPPQATNNNWLMNHAPSQRAR